MLFEGRAAYLAVTHQSGGVNPFHNVCRDHLSGHTLSISEFKERPGLLGLQHRVHQKIVELLIDSRETALCCRPTISR